VSDIAAVGITNQRETLVAWDITTGKPLHNAIVWCDLRTTAICHDLQLASPKPAPTADAASSGSSSSSSAAKSSKGDRDRFRASTGLSISTYFSAVKLLWLLRNSPAVRAAADAGTLRVGTIDSWLLYKLTATTPTGTGGVHVTDVTNASRTMLMSLHTRAWDAGICAELGVDTAWLPRIRSNSEQYGAIAAGALRGVALTGCIGDQQAALLGQHCVQPGAAKSTFGTGAFLLMNTGAEAVPSARGLLTTVAFQLGPKEECQYALEGSVAVAGAALSWLQSSLEIVSSPKEIDRLAESVPDNGGVYFVPAFSGLLSPHWRDDARGVIAGVTRYATRAHFCRAALEAAAFQTRDVLCEMEQEAGLTIPSLRVDGGMSRSALLCQFQADILQTPVVRAVMDERTALGAAMAAGIGAGVYADVEDAVAKTARAGLGSAPAVAAAPAAAAAAAAAAEGKLVYTPAMDTHTRARHLLKWTKAIRRALNWEDDEDDEVLVRPRPVAKL
jgi:glycerol kinase